MKSQILGETSTFFPITLHFVNGGLYVLCYFNEYIRLCWWHAEPFLYVFQADCVTRFPARKRFLTSSTTKGHIV